MKKLLLVLTGVTLIVSGIVQPAFSQVRSGPVPGRFIVKLSEQADPIQLHQALGKEDRLAPAFATKLDQSLRGVGDISRIYTFSTSVQSLSEQDIISLLGKENIEWVEPDYYLEFFDIPIDSLLSHQWYLINEGQEYYGIKRVDGAYNDELVMKSGTPGADINMISEYLSPPAERTKVVVGIVDTGVDVDHPELQGNIWINDDEIPDNGIDDDHNGYVDDVIGWDVSGDTVNFLNPIGDNDPRDEDGHGSHIAGIVAARDNGVGTVGIAPWVTILPVKIRPNGTSAIGAEGLIYAINNGARVINVSWGTLFQSQVLYAALDFARKNGVLVCIAPGNSGDNSRFYPAGFDLDSTLIVAAGNSDGFVTDFSTVGEHIDITAPGLDILSIRGAGTDMYDHPQVLEPEVRIIEEQYYLSDGTSMATPMIVGGAAYLWGVQPDLSLDEVIDALLLGADDLIDPLNVGDTLPGPDSLSGWGYFNLGSSVALVQSGGIHMTAPTHRSRHSGDVVIKAAGTNGYSGSWTLEYALGLNPSSWQTLATGSSLPEDSILYTFSDPTIDGFVSFRVADDNGYSQLVTVTLSRENVLELTSPINGDAFEYAIPLIGSAFGPDYKRMELLYRDPDGAVKSLFSSTAEYFDSLMFDWAASGTDTGSFTVYLFGYFDTGLQIDSAQVRLNSSFAEGWPRLLPGRAGMSPIACDLNGDGLKELAVATTSGLTLFQGATGEVVPGYPVLPGKDVRCVPAVYDVDRDGEGEIIVTNADGIHVFNYDGTYAEGWPQECFTGAIPYEYAYPQPVIVKLREGSPDGAVPDSGIMLINKLGRLLCYRFNGDRYFYSRELFAQFDARISNAFGMGGGTSPFVTSTDLRGDGLQEVVASFTSPAPYTGLGIFRGANGQPAFGTGSPTVEVMRQATGTVLADLDLDGNPEIITSGIDLSSPPKQRITIKTQGDQDFASWVVPIDTLWNGWLASYPIVADLDLDGIPEILSTYFEYDVSALFIYRADGTPYVDPPPGRPAGVAFYDPNSTFGTPGVANLLGDDRPEIIFRAGYLLPGTGPELLFILDNAAQPINGWPKATPARNNLVASSRYAPLVDDPDNDGLVELSLISDGGDLLVWDFPALYNDGANSFRFMADNYNSGIVKTSGRGAVAGGDFDLSVPSEISPAQNYPNPFNPSTVISFSLPSAQQVKIEIFNILGQKVTTLADRGFEAGDHEIEFDGSALANGVYFYRIKADGEVKTKKMLLIK